MSDQILAVDILVPAVYSAEAALIQSGAISIEPAQLVRYAPPAHFYFAVVIKLGAQANLGVEGAAPASLAGILERFIKRAHAAMQAITKCLRIVQPTGFLEHLGYGRDACAGHANLVGRRRVDGRRALGRMNARGSPPNNVG